MPVVERSLLINAPRDALFDLAQDYGLRLKWDPFLREMRFLDGADEAAVGVRVSVRAWTGLTMVAEYLTLNRPQLVAMKMVRGPFIFRQFAGSWQFQPHAGGSTEVTFRYQFETRWRGLWWLVNPVIAWVFGRDIRRRLWGLKREAEQMDLRGAPGV
ncbi:MAG: hypothetical protein AUI47_03645 [Acidobacteria bacterium 13_1_40CM_2_68_5]|nr:MAG: hypothetical protein AUI47_03645 [Acidobacteria bacterium 13_1_40CM_2_68_5]